ncbi:SRPBCC family protein [Tsuneonella flava]|uniref:SRPBCC family protein n=1 Tax=Tsuneonella flava TaxID=2055955 RepID=UPI00167FE2BC|nr:SRPBCC family protein [Tsuneonella flava]
MRKMILACLAGMPALLTAHGARAEVMQADASLFVTRDSVVVKTDTLATWLMLIKPGEWWNSGHTWSGDATNLTLTPQGGGCFCEGIPAKPTANSPGLAGSAQHMEVVLAEPGKALRMRGALGPLQSEPVQGVLTITMKAADEGGTRIVWEYVVGGVLRYPPDTISKAVDGVMSQQLNGLADKLGRIEAGEDKLDKVEQDAGSDPLLPDDAADVGAALDALANEKLNDEPDKQSGKADGNVAPEAKDPDAL